MGLKDRWRDWTRVEITSSGGGEDNWLKYKKVGKIWIIYVEEIDKEGQLREVRIPTRHPLTDERQVEPAIRVLKRQLGKNQAFLDRHIKRAVGEEQRAPGICVVCQRKRHGNCVPEGCSCREGACANKKPYQQDPRKGSTLFRRLTGR